MDANVWGRLPENLIWKVLQLVPAATCFQLQLVSRKWRKVLTSSTFRSKRPIESASCQSEKKRRRVVACAVKGYNDAKDVNVVNIESNISLWVPNCFWKSSSDFMVVVAAANGLVCISNANWKPSNYCVLNPLTRTCKVLPPIPFKPQEWLPPTPTAVTILGGVSKASGTPVVQVATYDLGAKGSGKWDLEVYEFQVNEAQRKSPIGHMAMCVGDGETYWYYKRRVHVVVPLPEGRLVDVAALDEPSVGLLGLVAPQVQCHLELDVRLVAHRDIIFFVKEVSVFAKHKEDVVMGIWRLARERLEWEVVALLRLAEVRLLTGAGWRQDNTIVLCGASGVREFVCCHVMVNMMSFMLGFNLDSGEWEVVCDKDFESFIHHRVDHERKIQDGLCWVCNLFELRPDVFL